MVGEDTVTRSTKELRRVHVLSQVLEKRITQREAGTMSRLTDRQIRCLLGREKEEGHRASSIGDGGSRRVGGSRGRSRPRPSGCRTRSMGTSGRHWRRRSWRSGKRSR
jgi:hypothetical protein